MTGFLLHTAQRQVNVLAEHIGCEAGDRVLDAPFSAIIQWGNGGLSSFTPGTVVLNGSEAIANTRSAAVKKRLLAVSGIPVAQKKSPSQQGVVTHKRYFAAVFQQEVVVLYRSAGRQIWLHNRAAAPDETFKIVKGEEKTKEVKKVMELAVRSVYCLGLDFGGVLLGVDSRGKIQVIDVQETFPINAAIAEKFSALFARFMDGYFNPQSHDIVLGADPEFVLRDAQGKVLMASAFFSKDGIVGCDQIRMRGDASHRPMPLAELRPEPASDPRTLFRNVYRAMLTGIRKVNSRNIQWAAGGMPLTDYPIGGHVHFSNLSLNSQLLRALDNYLALQILMLESPRSLLRRPRYGYLGDFRTQFHGGFEYRTLPSWLISPTITRGVFALSSIIASSYRQLRSLPLLDPAVQKAFYAGDKNVIAAYLPGLWEELEGLEEFAEHHAYLLPFKSLVLEQREWDEFTDIREVWKLPPFNDSAVNQRVYKQNMI